MAQLQNGPVHLLGGRVRGLTQATVGGETVEALGWLHCEVVFRHQRPDAHPRPVDPRCRRGRQARHAVRSARRKVVLADSSKVGATLLISFASLSDIDVLVDSGLPRG